ncbi:MAG TPA: hydrogenase maturation protease, partial [Verrucomicrobiota bacterium]|nr:hydrogenase maturation protease [Verrucomicrobiota bacterium]
MSRPHMMDNAASSAAPQTEPTGQRILVLGLGNDILCDDAIGLRVVREVRRQLRPDEEIDVEETEEMGLCLLDYISGYRGLVLVDSIQRGTISAGEVHEIRADDLRTLSNSAPHFLGIGETLALGRELGLPM